MTNYNEDILHSLAGETPKQKYETLINLMVNYDKFKMICEVLEKTPDNATLDHLRIFIRMVPKTPINHK